MIKVLIAEDSIVTQELLRFILESDDNIEVVGIASDGEEAIRMAHNTAPDVITMDIIMPKMDGYEATKKIMETYPVPIILISATCNPKELETTFQAIEAGAVAVLEKPNGPGHPDYDNLVENLIQMVKLMSEVKVVRRWSRSQKERTPVKSVPKAEYSQEQLIKIVAIGASTGGPTAIQKILSELPKDFPAPILIVQHIVAGFIEGLAEWLKLTTSLPIIIAGHGERLLKGHVYIAPDGYQLKVESNATICLTRDEPEHGLRPSVSYLFRSVAKAFGPNAVGVLLTGMGKDGAQELKLMRDSGAATIAQDEESSVIHGMPGEAIKLGAALHVLSPEKIAVKIKSFAYRKEE
jgi:two-component system, chemotaxis family, protein-glutamate methylesterase/glutaminase